MATPSRQNSAVKGGHLPSVAAIASHISIRNLITTFSRSLIFFYHFFVSFSSYRRSRIFLYFFSVNFPTRRRGRVQAFIEKWFLQSRCSQLNGQREDYISRQCELNPIVAKVKLHWIAPQSFSRSHKIRFFRMRKSW